MGNSAITDLSRLKRRLSAVFAVVAGLLIAGGAAYHAHHRASLRAGAEQLLLSTAQIKMDQLKDWRADRLSDTISLLDSPVLGLYLRRFSADRTDKEAAGLLRERLLAYLRHNPYRFAAIADEKGKVLLSVGSKPEITCTQFHALIPKALRSGRPEMGDFYLPEGDNSPHIDIVAPALPGSKAAGLLLLLRVDPADFLYPLLQAWSASGETGEILLVTRAGDDALFLNDVRHAKNAAMRLRRPITEEELPAAIALRGHSGIVKGLDYRGVAVLAAVGPVPGTDWALVTKMDMAEVLKGTRPLAGLLALLVLALLGAAGAAVYLTFLREAEKSAELLKRLTDQVPGVVYQYRLYPDGSSCFPYASSGMEMIYEVTPEEVREDAAPVFGRLHPDELKATSEAIFASARDLSIFHWEFRVVLPRQGLRWRLCDARPERLPDGSTLWHGIITDATERKKAQEELDKERGKAAAYIEMSGAIFVALEADQSVSLINSRGCALLGRPREEIMGANWFDLAVPPEQRERVKQVFGALLRGEGEIPEFYDNEIITAQGGRRVISWHNIVRRDEAGRAIGTVSSGEDVTEQRAAQQRIEALNKELAAKNKEMENFLYITTHDLRSPLVNIQGFSQNLQGYLSEIGKALAAAGLPQERKEQAKKLAEEKVPEALGFVLESSAKMDALLSALLKVSRLGRQQLKPEELEMEPLLRRIVDTMRFQVEQAGAEIKIGPLPPCKADAVSVGQLFSNLIDNAVKYRDPARPLIVEVSGESLAGKAVYRVADNGPGIPEAELEKLWSVFYKPARSGRKNGEGIGLPMCKRIAERNGGSIRVEPAPGGGTVFVVELPLV